VGQDDSTQETIYEGRRKEPTKTVPFCWKKSDVVLSFHEVEDIIGECSATDYKVHHRGCRTEVHVYSPNAKTLAEKESSNATLSRPRSGQTRDFISAHLIVEMAKRYVLFITECCRENAMKERDI